MSRIAFSELVSSDGMPYSIRAYNLMEHGEIVRSVPADAVWRSRSRQGAIEEIKKDIEQGTEWRGHAGSLWKTVTLFEGYKFKTSGRGAEHKGAVRFSYQLKISSRSGEATEELFITV